MSPPNIAWTLSDDDYIIIGLLCLDRSHMLQADSENECQAWINAIQAGVSKAYRDGSLSLKVCSTTV